MRRKRAVSPFLRTPPPADVRRPGLPERLAGLGEAVPSPPWARGTARDPRPVPLRQHGGTAHGYPGHHRRPARGAGHDPMGKGRGRVPLQGSNHRGLRHRGADPGQHSRGSGASHSIPAAPPGTNEGNGEGGQGVRQGKLPADAAPSRLPCPDARDPERKREVDPYRVGSFPVTTLEFSLLVWLGSLAAGFLGSLTGLGGGVVIVPLLALRFGVDIRYAIGASLVSVLATSSAAAAAYVKEGYSNLRLGMFLEIATTIGARAGAFLAARMSPSAIAVIFGAVLFYSAYLSNRPRPEHPSAARPDPLATFLRVDSTYPPTEGLQPHPEHNV